MPMSGGVDPRATEPSGVGKAAAYALSAVTVGRKLFSGALRHGAGSGLFCRPDGRDAGSGAAREYGLAGRFLGQSARVRRETQ
jgi:hypothetical protein